VNSYYVYLHKTKDGVPFYVGKGKGKRAWSTDRNTNWKEFVNTIGEYDVEIVNDKLSEKQSLEIEKNLISTIGITNLTNILEEGYESGESPEYLKAEESLNDFINLCKIYDSL
jgi:hypothetical protein